MSVDSLETTFCKVPSFPLLTMILQNLAYCLILHKLQKAINLPVLDIKDLAKHMMAVTALIVNC